MNNFFSKLKNELETAYLASDTPWGQSGFSGPYERWEALRSPIADCIDKSGTFLDIGCANGYLLQCLLVWLQEKNHGTSFPSNRSIVGTQLAVSNSQFTRRGRLPCLPNSTSPVGQTSRLSIPILTASSDEIIPYGLDLSEKLVALAQQRLPDFTNNIYVGNALTWNLPIRFDYVRTELCYVPESMQEQYIRRLLSDFLNPDGKLLVADYRSKRSDLTHDWCDTILMRMGFKVAEVKSGFWGTLKST